MSSATQSQGTRTPRAGTQRNSQVAADIRTLAKDRARRKARISKRAAVKTRAMLGGVALGVVAVIAWVAALVATFPIIVAAIATGVIGVYLVGFSYLVGEINKANESDRSAIDAINAKMSGSQAFGTHAGSSARPAKPQMPFPSSRQNFSLPANAASVSTK